MNVRLIAILLLLFGCYAHVAAQTCENEQALSQLQQVHRNWHEQSLLRLTDDFPADAPGYVAMTNHLGEEDGLHEPLRTGQETAFYNALKAKIVALKPGEKLDAPQLLQLGLASATAENGRIYLPKVYLTIVNVIRLLARPQQWIAGPQPGDYGHPESDPAYPILQDVLGISASDNTPTMADIFRLRRNDKGQIMQLQYSMHVLFGKNGVFKYQDGAPSAEVNAGAHYYFWTGALGHRYFGSVGVRVAGWEEQAIKWWHNAAEQGRFQICHLHNGKTFSQQLHNLTSAVNDADLQPQNVLLALSGKISRVDSELRQLETADAQSKNLCQQLNAQHQQGHLLAVSAHELMTQLRALMALAKQDALACDTAQDLVAGISALQQKTEITEQQTIAQLDRAIALAAKCTNSSEADKIAELYQISKNNAAAIQVDAAIAQGKNNKLHTLTSALDAVLANKPSLEQLREDIGAVNSQQHQLASSAVGVRDLIKESEQRLRDNRTKLADIIEQLGKEFPEMPPPNLAKSALDAGRDSWQDLSDRLAKISPEGNCPEALANTGKLVQQALDTENLFAEADETFISARNCSLLSMQDSEVATIAASANWLLSAIDINRDLAQKVKKCRSKSSPQPDTDNQTFNAMHLFQLQDKKGKTFYLLYANAEISHLDKHKFRFPDGTGGYYHYAGQDLGVYKDKAGICPVLRSKGIFSVTYNLGSWSVVCDKTAAVTANQTALQSESASQPLKPVDRSLEVQLLNYLMIDFIYGDVQLFLNNQQQAQKLTRNAAIVPGSTLVSAKNASAQISVAGTQIEIGEATSVRWLPAEKGAQSASQLELHRGSLLVDHPTPPDYGVEGRVEGGAVNSGISPAETPGFEDLEIVSPHAHIRPQGTRYRVTVNDQDTVVEVMAGRVKLTGKMLARTDANLQLQGKYAFQTELMLEAGQYGKAFSVNVGQPAVPAWLDHQNVPGATTNPESADGGENTLPDWLANGNNSTTTATAASQLKPLATAQPWLLSQVQAWMDQWLKQAHPTITKPGLSFRYSDWGVLLSSAATAAGAPEHPAGWTRFRYVWERREHLTSWNLCRLDEYLQHRQDQQDLADCIGPAPAPQSLVSPSNSADTVSHATAPMKPEVAKGTKKTSRAFSNWLHGWSCQYQGQKSDWSKMVPFGLSYQHGQLFLQYQRKRHPLTGLPENDHYLLILDFPGMPVTLDLRFQAGALTGNQRWTADSINHSNPVRCERSSATDDMLIYGRR